MDHFEEFRVRLFQIHNKGHDLYDDDNGFNGAISPQLYWSGPLCRVGSPEPDRLQTCNSCWKVVMGRMRRIKKMVIIVGLRKNEKDRVYEDAEEA